MKFEEAIRIAQSSPSPDDRFIEACTAVLTALGGQRYVRALSDLDEAVRLHPTFDRAYVNRASVYSILREDQKALSDYDRSIDLDPANPIAYFGRAQLFRRLGMIDKAIADVGMARAFDEGNPHFERLWEQLLNESWTATTKPN